MVFDNVYDWERGTTAEQVEATVRAAGDRLSRYIFMSSVAAYGDGLNHKESDPLAPDYHANPYVRHKAGTERLLFRMPPWVDPLCGALGIAIFAAIVYSGFAGAQEANRNLAPTAIYVIFWVGLVVASLFFGDVFRAFNPWLAVARVGGWLAGRVRAPGAGTLRNYPEWLGNWPAVAGICRLAADEMPVALSVPELSTGSTCTFAPLESTR